MQAELHCYREEEEEEESHLKLISAQSDAPAAVARLQGEFPR